MPPEIQNDQALDLKKRARRRLVGAVALVILMIIVLPMIIKDKAVPEAPKEDIKISMPEGQVSENLGQESATQALIPNTQSATESTLVQQSTNATESTVAADQPQVVTENTTEKVEPVVAKPQAVKETPVETKPKVVKPDETKPAEQKIIEPVQKPTEAKTKAEAKNGDFTIQIGVFSDPANVAQLQSKLKASGFNSRTEKINTPKGEKIRLRVGKYATRQDAADELSRLNSTGMTGMVITNK